MKKQLLWLLATCIILNWYVKSTLQHHVDMNAHQELIAQKKAMLSKNSSLAHCSQQKRAVTA